jgi:hypothetical protein
MDWPIFGCLVIITFSSFFPVCSSAPLQLPINNDIIIGSTVFGISTDATQSIADMIMREYRHDLDVQIAIVNMLMSLPNSTVPVRLPRHEPPFMSNGCSTECKCSAGGLSGYGRYCGMLYSGCEGYPPCDDIDYCCMVHDGCVGENGYTDCACSRALAQCAACAFYRRKLGYVSESFAWTCHHSSEVASMIPKVSSSRRLLCFFDDG